MQDVAAAGHHEALERPADAGLDGVELGQRAVVVGVALDGQHRHVDPGEDGLDVPRAELGATARRRSSPRTRRRRRRGSGPAARAGRSTGTRAPAAAIPATETSSTTTCGASRTRPATGWPLAGVEQGDGGAVAVADEDRPLQPSRASTSGSTSSGLVGACSATGQGRSSRRRAAVAGAGVHEGRRSADRGACTLVGKRAPQLDASRGPRGGSTSGGRSAPGGPARAVVQLVRASGRTPSADRQRGQVRPPGPRRAAAPSGRVDQLRPQREALDLAGRGLRQLRPRRRPAAGA